MNGKIVSAIELIRKKKSGNKYYFDNLVIKKISHGSNYQNPKDKEQTIVIEAFLNALKVPFERSKDKSPYNPDFVKKILQGDQDRKEGKGKKFTIKELNDLWK